MNAQAKITQATLLSPKARAHMASVDREHEQWCKRKGYLREGGCHGFRVTFRSLTHGGTWDDDRIYATRADALEAAHGSVIPNHVFERIDRVNTAPHSLYEGEDYFTTPRVTAGMGGA